MNRFPDQLSTAPKGHLPLLCLLCLGLLLGSLPSQKPEDRGPFPAAMRTITFINPFAGSYSIPCLVAYPGKNKQNDAPLQTKDAPYPVILLAHGFGWTGTNYLDLAKHYASWGFVVVAHHTHSLGPMTQQILDLKAISKILQTEYTQTASFFYQAIDPDRLGVCGHSMGGGSVAGLLAEKINLKAAVLLSPWRGELPDASEWMRASQVPFQIIAGQGDQLVPPHLHGQAFYQKGDGVIGYRGLTLLWKGCIHGSLAQPGKTWEEIESFRLARRQSTAFFQAHLQGLHGQFDILLRTVHLEPYIATVQYESTYPNLYLTGTARVGGVIQYNCIGNPLTVVITYVAPRPDNISFGGMGTLGISPAFMVALSQDTTTKLRTFHLTYPLPNLPVLAGVDLWLQSITYSSYHKLHLTPTRKLTIKGAK